MTIKILTLVQARVLGTLMEKARTVPDSYPLSLNALVAGCNQKTSREPLMQASDTEVQQALDALAAQSLVFANQNGRTRRYEHNFQRAVGVSEAAAVLLGLLMLRGPQTAGELRLNAERWYRFADMAAVDGVLHDLLAQGEERGWPLILRLPRAPGAREQRWAHLLCGEPVLADLADSAEVDARAVHGDAGAAHELAALTQRVAWLETQLAALCEQLGVPSPNTANTVSDTCTPAG